MFRALFFDGVRDSFLYIYIVQCTWPLFKCLSSWSSCFIYIILPAFLQLSSLLHVVPSTLHYFKFFFLNISVWSTGLKGQYKVLLSPSVCWCPPLTFTKLFLFNTSGRNWTKLGNLVLKVCSITRCQPTWLTRLYIVHMGG